MTAAERSREATVRNQARRDMYGDESAFFKWCGQCFEDKALNMFHKDGKRMFGRKGRCKACLLEDSRLGHSNKGEKSTAKNADQVVEPAAMGEPAPKATEDARDEKCEGAHQVNVGVIV